MSPEKVTAAIVGPGNIGTDLLAKLKRSAVVDVAYMVGVVESDGLARAREEGVAASAEGVDWLLRQDPLPQIVFEATSAAAHLANAPRYAEAGIQAVDLTPAHLGPMVCPPVNLRDAHRRAQRLDDHLRRAGDDPDGARRLAGHAGAVRGDRRLGGVALGGPRHPRQHRRVHPHHVPGRRGGRAGPTRGKAIIILNPVEPPMIMRDTVFCMIGADADRAAIAASIHEMVADVQQYVPGYTLRAEPQFDEPREQLGRPRPRRGVPRGQGQRRLPARPTRATSTS